MTTESRSVSADVSDDDPCRLELIEVLTRDSTDDPSASAGDDEDQSANVICEVWAVKDEPSDDVRRRQNYYLLMLLL